MRKFFNKLRYRIARAIAPTDSVVMSECDFDKSVLDMIADSISGEFKKGIRLGIRIILDYMKHLNGLQADEWCKKAYEYTEWKMNNLSISVEKKSTDEGVEVCFSVPKDFEDGDGNKDLTPQD